MHEFNLIEAYFTWGDVPKHVKTSVGDDAAVLDIPPNTQLVTSVDTLISGVHFPKNTPPNAIGHKALAVNLSDLAAMGATPKWFTLALTLPEIDNVWLEGFSQGLKTLAQQHDCFLIGGDTTRGPLSITIQAMGLVGSDSAVLRSGAKVGDKIYITGTLGDAAYGLEHQNNKACKRRLDYPTPRIDASSLIKNHATSCIDISDGLLQDLSHVLNASSVGAQLDLSAIPLSKTLHGLELSEALKHALNGGDDYELLFTVPEGKKAPFEKKASKSGGVYFTCIGVITEQVNLIVDKKANQLNAKGYNHFHE